MIKIVYTKQVKKQIKHLPFKQKTNFFTIGLFSIVVMATGVGAIKYNDSLALFTPVSAHIRSKPEIQEPVNLNSLSIEIEKQKSIKAAILENEEKIKENKKLQAENEKKQKIATFIAKKYRIAKEASTLIVNEAFNAGKKYNIEPELLISLIAIESGFNPLSESAVGAKGLVQVMPIYHQSKIQTIEQRSGHVLNIADNIELGASIYKDYLNRYNGNITKALQQYNGSLEDPNQTYSKKVLSFKESLKHLG